MLSPAFNWRIANPDTGRVRSVMAELQLAEPVARALVNRGMDSPGKARDFLNPGFDTLHDPFLLNDMDKAVERAAAALRESQRILIVGDYDVDGVTGTSLLMSFFQKQNARVRYHIPNRETEGYGLSVDVVRKAGEVEYNLLIVVDSGTTAFDAVNEAKKLGIDVLILDHHEQGENLPAALAVVNPKRRDSSYPFRELAAVGVAFKFLQGLSQSIKCSGDWMETGAELVALGTVADMMPLIDENRVFVTRGLEKLSKSGLHGVSALINVVGMADGQEVTASSIGFSLAPRINAAGRMWDPRAGVEMLLTDDPDRAAALAGKLDEKNRERIQEERRTVDTALKILESTFDSERDKAVVLFSENWLAGVVGIVAARILERIHRPVILFTTSNRPEDLAVASPQKGRVLSGSARSIDGIDIHSALEKVSSLLISFGGHAMAAGMRIHENDLPVFRERLNSVIADVYDGPFRPSLNIDSEVPIDAISLELLEQVGRLEPCGIGNPKPVFYAKGLTILESRQCGLDGKHLRVKLGQGSSMRDAIGFGLGDKWQPSDIAGAAVDAAFVLREDNFRGRRDVSMQIRDMRQA